MRDCFTALVPGDGRIDGMPVDWIWTNRRLGRETSNVYLVYPSNSRDDRLGAMKIYRNSDEMGAKRELLALRTLQSKFLFRKLLLLPAIFHLDESAIVSIYQSNICDRTRKRNAPIWMITSMITELTLKDYLDGQKSTMTFYQALTLTRQLLEIVRQCHHASVLHRNLHPSNILVKKNNDPTSVMDEIKLVLIGFDIPWIDSKQFIITDGQDLKMIQKYSNESSNDTFCTFQRFLCSNSSENQRHSPTIDSTAVCYIFFWLLTHQWPDQMPCTDIQPHNEPNCHQQINDKLGRVIRYYSNNIEKYVFIIGDVQLDRKLYDQVMLIFDRTFVSIDRWWLTDELLDHLNNLEVSYIEFERAQLIRLFPTTETTALSPLNDQYARIVSLIARVKQQFAEQYSTCIQWSKNSNKWSTKNKDIEVKNTGELVYNYQDRQCTLTIVLFAKIDSNPPILFLGNGDEDETVELKLLCKLNNETTEKDVRVCFDDALKKIIREKLNQENSSCQ